MTQSGYSPKTIKAYVNHVNRYLQFSEGAIDEACINNYMVDLGHASSKTTEIYTHVSQVAMQNIVNPLDDL